MDLRNLFNVHVKGQILVNKSFLSNARNKALTLIVIPINNMFCVVFQVAKLNPKDSSYSLRDDFYRHVQRDWPGHSEEERQLVSRLLARWVRGRGSLMVAS